MKVFKFLIFVFFISSVPVGAKPFLLTGGNTIQTNQFIFNFRFLSGSFKNSHNDSGDRTPFSSQETRELFMMPIRIGYGLPTGDEINLMLSYIDMKHNTEAGEEYKKASFGDLAIHARSLWKDVGEAQLALGIGVVIPTGKSIFDYKNERRLVR